MFQAHTPGVSNVIPDILSRRIMPGSSWELPLQLEGVPEFSPPPRDDAFFQANIAPVARLVPRSKAVLLGTNL